MNAATHSNLLVTPRGARRVLWGMMAGLAALLAVFSLHYLRPGMPDGFAEQLPVYREHAVWFLLHVSGGALALLIGPWQFLARARARRPRLHRRLGWMYAVGVLAGGIGGLYVAPLAFGGVVVHLSFALLAVVWIATTGIAIAKIRSGDVAGHRRWMIRSCALTFAAVTQRLWLVSLDVALPFEAAYQAAALLGWLPNLVAVEWWLRRHDCGGTPVRAPQVVGPAPGSSPSRSETTWRCLLPSRGRR
jgi:uncharacterized membrane protein